MTASVGLPTTAAAGRRIATLPRSLVQFGGIPASRMGVRRGERASVSLSFTKHVDSAAPAI